MDSAPFSPFVNFGFARQLVGLSLLERRIVSHRGPLSLSISVAVECWTSQA
jgi:hypothetical protein